ncbi:MAG: hypothetical protein CMJ83_02310 [Planctomycetes bacterium]|nr:hypothetical protein [Planctomycetota bacterium]
MNSKVLRVARNEYLNTVRTKAFIISVIVMPLFMGGSVVVQAFLHDRKDLTDRRVAVVDRTGRLFERLATAADGRNDKAIWSEEGAVREQTDARWLLESASDDEAALSDRVRADELFAYVIIPPNVIEAPGKAAVAYHTNTPTYEGLPRWLGNLLNEEIRRERFAAANLDQDTVERLVLRVPLRKFGLVEMTAEGVVKEAEEVNEIANFAVPLGAMMLLFLLVMMAGPMLLNNVLEEKMQRISEVLISSVSPFELFLGKLVGTVFVSWTLAVLYLGGVAFLAHRFEFAHLIPGSLYLWFAFFHLAALFIFGSIFSGLGAACSELRDAQAMMMPAMVIVMIPMFTWVAVIQAPDSTFSTALSLFPPATPFIMLVRLAVPPGPAAWEIIAAVVLTIAFSVACVWAASRIFRVGVLSQGQAPSFRKLFGWIFAD